MKRNTSGNLPWVPPYLLEEGSHCCKRGPYSTPVQEILEVGVREIIYSILLEIAKKKKKKEEEEEIAKIAIGEGNGTPLQYSCLENPRDGGAW